jgi:uroporphyrinogen-III synthase
VRPNERNAIVSLGEITILISGFNQSCVELTLEFRQLSARVIILPRVELGAPADYEALDESIANLFGYDWIVFKNVPAVDYFLRRFRELKHETSELDSLRICALGETTLRRLEESHIHVDLFVDSNANEVLETFENYLGGREALRGMNFLIPNNGRRPSFSESFEEAGARADYVAAYRILQDNVELGRIRALLFGGGIDAILLTNLEGVESFANLVAAEDMSWIPPAIATFCLGEGTAKAAAGFGFKAEITTQNDAAVAISRALAGYSARQ